MFKQTNTKQKPDSSDRITDKKATKRNPHMWLASAKNEKACTGLLEETYKKYWHEICHYIRAKYGDGPPDPEDIAQATFAKFTAYKTPEHINNPRAFLYSMARNAFVDFHRRKATWDKFVAEEQASIEINTTADFDPERVLIGKEEFAMLESALEILDKRQRSFLLAHRLQGLSYTEIARQSGMSRNGVKGIIKQALAICQEKMQAAEDKDDRL